MEKNGLINNVLTHEERVNLIIKQAEASGINLYEYKGFMMATNPKKLSFTVAEQNVGETIRRTWILETSYKIFTS